MATTTNYGWTTPDDTDLVKNGASAIRTLGSSVDTTTKNLNPETTLGDISYQSSTANTKTRLPIGSAGQVLGVSGGVPAWVSAGAINWTQRTGQTTTGNSFTKIAYNGSNLYVAAGNGGTLYTSPDGQSWTSRTSGFGSNAIRDVAFGNSLWVAVGDNGTITTSSDGITWTARTANMSTNTIYAVHYANSTWVAVGAGGGATNTGGITYSTNGTTWTRVSMTPSVGTTYWGVVYNGTNWVVTTQLNTNNTLTASTPSGTWTASSSGSGRNNGYIYWDGTRHYYTTSSTGSSSPGGTWYYSTSTTLASSVATDLSGPGGAGTKVLYGGVIYTLQYNIFAFDSVSNAIPSNVKVIANNLPTVQPGQSSVNDNGLALFVGAAGYIITDGSRFWTSF